MNKSREILRLLRDLEYAYRAIRVHLESFLQWRLQAESGGEVENY